MDYSIYYNKLKFSGLMLLLVIICIIALTACGKKGPLYLPQAPVVVPAPVKVDNSDKTKAQVTSSEEPIDSSKSTKKSSEQK
jgi:predicted small lipoprotein YifL